MSDAALPIDPSECQLALHRDGAVNATITARVPARLVKRFHKKLRRSGRDAGLSETRSALLMFLCKQAAEAAKARIVSPPLAPEGKAFAPLSLERDYEAEIHADCAADLDWPGDADIELLEPDATLADDLVDEELWRQRLQFGTRRPAAAVGTPSAVQLDVSVRLGEGESPIQSQSGVTVILAVESEPLRVLEASFAGGVAALAGTPVGSAVTIASTYPIDFAAASLRGLEALLEVRVLAAFSIDPASVDQVVAEYGAGNEARLRSQIRFALEEQRAASVRKTLREQMGRAVVELLPIELPRCRMRMLMQRAEAEVRGIGRARGWDAARIDERWLEVREQTERAAARAARERVILQSLPRLAHHSVSETQILERIATVAAQQGVRPEEYRERLVASGRFEDFVGEVLAESVLDALIETVRVRQVPEAELRALLEARER